MTPPEDLDPGFQAPELSPSEPSSPASASSTAVVASIDPAWRAAVAAWLTDISAGPDAVTVDTSCAYERFVGRFFEWLPPGHYVNGGTVREWLDNVSAQPGHNGKAAAASTVNLHLVALRSFCRWAVREGHLDHDPTDGIRGRRRRGVTKHHKRDELTANEVLALLAACREDERPVAARDGAIIALMAYTAVRTVEVHRADRGDLRTLRGRRVLWVQGKGRDEADEYVVIPAAAEPYIRRWLAVWPVASGPLFVSLSRRSHGRRLSRKGIREAIKGRFAAVGITEHTKTTHSLRHSAISAAIRNGATPIQAQSMARHANLQTTMIYYHEAERLEDPAEDLVHYR